MDILINQSLVVGSSFLSKDLVAGTAAITVENSEQFTTANGLIVIGQIGTPNCELITVLSSKSATVLSLGSACQFAHARGEPIQQVTYDKVVIESSTSATGVFTVLATINVQWSADKTSYNDVTGTSSTYYRQRYYNSVAAVYSDYSNAGIGVSQGDYGPTTAGNLISSVRKSVGNTGLTDDFFIDALNTARRIVDTAFGFGNANEWRQNFNYPIQMLAGTNYVNLPSDIDFSDTNRSIINARYARQAVAANLPLNYVDKRAWNSYSWQSRWTVTSGATLSGATSLILSTTGDFAATGTVYIATESPTQSILTVTYTGNNLATNTLTGCTGITRDITNGTQVAAYPTNTFPYTFTVYDGKLWFNSFIPVSLQGRNLYIDYYKKIEDIVFLADVIPEHFRDIYKDYLKFAIKRRRDDSIGEDDQDYIKFKNAIANVLGNPYTGQSIIIK